MRFVGLAGIIVSATMAFAPTVSLAGTDCRCRANGTYFQLGDIVCIGTPGNRRLAQCDIVLNNTSWTILAKECPSALLVPSDGQGTRRDVPLTPARTPETAGQSGKQS